MAWQQWDVRSHIVHGFAAFAGDWHSSGAGRATTRHSEIDNESRSNAVSIGIVSGLAAAVF